MKLIKEKQKNNGIVRGRKIKMRVKVRGDVLTEIIETKRGKISFIIALQKHNDLKLCIL